MGPIGILCIQRTLNKGREAGWWTGIGAAISDLFYCLLTGFGMSLVTQFIEHQRSILQIVGSIILLIFGIYQLRQNPSKSNKKQTIEDTDEKKKETHYQDMVSGFGFTLSNPFIIFLIIPLFARFDFPGELTWPFIILGYLLIVLGAIAWWTVITYLVNAVRSHFNIRSMWIINIAIGFIIIIISIYGLASAMLNYL